MSGELLRSDPADGIVTLTLNRPDRKNALSIALRDAVSDALAQLAVDPDVRVCVLTGAGTVFSAGFDLEEFEREDPDRLWASSDRFHHACLEFPLPLVAAVNGPAVAGGFDLAVLCDIRVAASTAWFAHPEREHFSVVYGPLHELVGGAVARDLCFTGRRVDAEEALALRLVSRVVPPGKVAAAAAETARQIAVAPRDVLMAMKAKAIARSGIGSETPTLDL
ncbi:MAG TPA: enoyl-CoA hydratase/isomerase family protein [Acidimicrobiia bacterium]|nr:enoyl-CoA hydratase/isomerase family protein [Acidimicrobiia bacterium]